MQDHLSKTFRQKLLYVIICCCTDFFFFPDEVRYSHFFAIRFCTEATCYINCDGNRWCCVLFAVHKSF